MILTQEYLKQEAERRGINSDNQKRIVNESNNLFFERKKDYDLFLSHSFLDKKLVLTLVDLFNKAGYYVYVDWIEDKQLDRNNVTAVTADFIKSKIKQCIGLSYIPTSNIVSSKWCPWELGVADGIHDGMVCILPVPERGNTFNGQEYLKLYPYIAYEKRKKDKEYDFWVYDSTNSSEHIILRKWLNGKKPYKH